MQVNVLEEYPSKMEAEIAAGKYKQAYPREGYGTSAGVYPKSADNPDGPWMMSASRDSSCD